MYHFFEVRAMPSGMARMSPASTVTLLELTGMARTIIARTYLPVEIFFAAGMFYLAMSFVLVQAFKLLERWLRVDACQGR